MMLSFKGGCKEIGRSAILIDRQVYFDYGLKTGDNIQFPYDDIKPRAALITHAHLDHCGAVPSLVSVQPEIFMTPPTFSLLNLLAEDTLKIAEQMGRYMPFDYRDLDMLRNDAILVDYDTEFNILDYKTFFLNAGHIPGSSSIYFEDEKNSKSIFYTGDINTANTRLINPASDFPSADTLILESTYFDEEHPSRKETERKFIESVQETLDIGGNVIIPAFAIGRTQELVMLLDAYNNHPFIDGMGIRAFDLLKEHPNYLRNLTHLKRAFRNSTFVDSKKRHKVPLENSVIVTTSGMLNGGPVMYYIDKLHKDPKTKLILTGHQVAGTNGHMLLESGNIINKGKMQKINNVIEQFDFSAHCGDNELKSMVKHFCDNGTENIFVVHGENTDEFAAWIKNETGVSSFAPANGENYVI